MKVICKFCEMTDELAKTFGVETSLRPQYPLTKGKEYVVLSLSQRSIDLAIGSCSIVDVIDDYGRLRPVPAYMFEVADPTPSLYWKAFMEGGYIGFSHPALRTEFFADNLSEGVPDVVQKWEVIKAQFLSET